jgi:glycerol-3-phosphate acyltransferase PlsY
MTQPNALAVVVIAGYLLGSIPFGLLLTRAAGLGDIRKMGSGNIGATNVLRTGRKGLAAATLLLDAAKGAAAVLLGHFLGGVPGTFLGGIAGVLGHTFPVWLKFRGGKGVATAYGVLIAAYWPVGIASGAVWIATAAAFRMSSLAGLVSFAAAPVLAWALRAPQPILGLSLAVTALIWLRHKDNIRRLLAGTEPRIGRKT